METWDNLEGHTKLEAPPEWPPAGFHQQADFSGVRQAFSCQAGECAVFDCSPAHPYTLVRAAFTPDGGDPKEPAWCFHQLYRTCELVASRLSGPGPHRVSRGGLRHPQFEWGWSTPAQVVKVRSQSTRGRWTVQTLAGDFAPDCVCALGSPLCLPDAAAWPTAPHFEELGDRPLF